MKQLSILIFNLIIFLAVQNVFSQLNGKSASDEAEKIAQQDRNQQERLYKLGGLDKNGMIKRDETYFPVSRTKLTETEKEQIKAIKAVLIPNPEDKEKYKTFLKQSDTGLFLLVPDFDCESKFTIKIDDKCVNVIPGASTYSFRQKNYTVSEPKYFDIQLKENALISKGFLAQGILTSLGDVPLEDVSLTGNGMKFLTDFKPETEIQSVRNQYNEIENGIKADGYVYSNLVKAEVNMTYALRVIAYRKSLNTVNQTFLNVNDSRFVTLIDDKRKDLILAFRIIRKSDDGIITIIWKELDSHSAPKLVYPKNEKLADFKPKN